MQVSVAPGAAVVDGYTYWNTTPLTLTLDAADGNLPRRDLVLLRLDLAARTMYCTVRAGTPAASPLLLEPVRDGEIAEIPLAAVFVSAGETVVEAAHITDLRPRADYILNPKDVEAAVAEYAAALEAYFGAENAEALISASRILRTDAGADTVLHGDGVYRALPALGTAMTELCRFTASGTFDPADYPTVDGAYTVVLQGAGGSGAVGAESSIARGGDAGGYAVVQVMPHLSAPFAVTVGVGGKGVIAASAAEYRGGNPGGDTSFGPFRVRGGAGGTLGITTFPPGFTYGAYTSEVGSIGMTGRAGGSLFSPAVRNNGYEQKDAADGGIGAGGAAQAFVGYYSGNGGDGIVIVYGCPA